MKGVEESKAKEIFLIDIGEEKEFFLLGSGHDGTSEVAKNA